MPPREETICNRQARHREKRSSEPTDYLHFDADGVVHCSPLLFRIGWGDLFLSANYSARTR
jgi:hypothetical protein